MKHVEKMPKWRQLSYKKWLKNRGKYEYSKNLIERAKYCLHEWRWFMSRWTENEQKPTYSFWIWTKHWVMAFFLYNNKKSR